MKSNQTTSERLADLRRLMDGEGLSAYLIPSSDPHGSEYVPSRWMKRQWMSGFTGSAGELIVTKETAGLWTDSRYFLQAENELTDTGIVLHQLYTDGVLSPEEWLGENLTEGRVLGADPRLVSRLRAKELENHLSSSGGSIRWLDEDLIDRLWLDRPDLPDSSVKVHPHRYAGESVEEKLNRLRADMRSKGADFLIVSALDSIAWLFNIRGEDIPYNPLVVAYGIVGTEMAELFIPLQKINNSVKVHLSGQVDTREYDSFSQRLKALLTSDKKVWIDPKNVSQWVASIVEKAATSLNGDSPIPGYKAVKNSSEIDGWRKAHVRDGVAMVRFLRWLEEKHPVEEITELSAAEVLENLRAEQDLYRGPSFETIAAFGEHGASAHYKATPSSFSVLEARGLFLLDSGAQYLDGTTDITRTLTLGVPTADEKRAFTLVLKGHINLASARFPEGTNGLQLDALARSCLWRYGLNYGHGTGHGIGSFLCVHEGPQTIGNRERALVPLVAGMFLSIEPGYYVEGQFGIRIENLVIVAKDPEISGFLRFEPVTVCPIDKRLIDPNYLDKHELEYLNAYHNRVRQTLSPHLMSEDRRWLTEATEPIR